MAPRQRDSHSQPLLGDPNKKVHFTRSDEIEEGQWKRGMWADTKHDEDPTALQSLQAIARRAGLGEPNDQAAILKWSLSLYNNLPSMKYVMRVVHQSSVAPVKNWLWSFTAEGRAAKTKRDWEEAVNKAEETLAMRERMGQLRNARQRRDEETGTNVSSAHGHRNPVRLRKNAATASRSAEATRPTARVAVSAKPGRKASSDITVPGFEYRKPTASRPKSIYEPHGVFLESAKANVTEVRKFGSRITNENNNSSHIKAACGKESPKEMLDSVAPPAVNLPRPLPPIDHSIDLVNNYMYGAGEDSVLFGRWRHHKDTPLPHLKDMIEQELRGPGAKSLYGPILNIADHPLVRHYNKRLEKALEDPNFDASQVTPLSPIMMKGCSAFHRMLLRDATDVGFSMEEGGTFRATGFQRRTSSIGSTMSTSPSGDMHDTSSFNEEVEASMNNIESGARNDSAVFLNELQHEVSDEHAQRGTDADDSEAGNPELVDSPKWKLELPADAHLGRYEVLNKYSRDVSANLKYSRQFLSDDEAPRDRRQRPGCATAARHRPGAPSRDTHIRVSARNTAVSPAGEEQQQNQRHRDSAAQAESLWHHDTPRPDQQQSKFKLDVPPSEILNKRHALYRSEKRPNLHFPTTEIREAQRIGHALQRVRGQPDLRQRPQTSTVRHAQQVQQGQQVQQPRQTRHPLQRVARRPDLRLQTDLVPVRQTRPPLPVAERPQRRPNLRPENNKVIIAKPEDAENAFLTDSEDEDNDDKPLRFHKKSPAKVVIPSPKSELTKSLSQSGSADKPTNSTRPVAANASAASSHVSSNGTGSHSSTEHSTARTTPAIIGSAAGSKGKGKSAAVAEHIAKRLAEHIDDSESDGSFLPFAQKSTGHLSESGPSDSEVAACAEALLRVK